MVVAELAEAGFSGGCLNGQISDINVICFQSSSALRGDVAYPSKKCFLLTPEIIVDLTYYFLSVSKQRSDSLPSPRHAFESISCS